MPSDRTDRIKQIAARLRSNQRWPELKATLERCLGCDIHDEQRLPEDEGLRLTQLVIPLYAIDASDFWRRFWPLTQYHQCAQFLSKWASLARSPDIALLTDAGGIKISLPLVCENIEVLLGCYQAFALADISGENVLEISKEEHTFTLSISGKDWRPAAESVET